MNMKEDMISTPKYVQIKHKGKLQNKKKQNLGNLPNREAGV